MTLYYYSPRELLTLDKYCGVSSLREKAFGYVYLDSMPVWEDVAERVAKDYYDNHDGWEDDWPISFRVWDEEGVWVGDYEVSLDYEPTFNATEVFE